jgi:interferon gamma-inducible protein 30
MDLKVVPFGNAQVDKQSQTVKCQHGEGECDANTWEQCAVEQSKPSVYMEFLLCLENTLAMGHADDPFPASLFMDCAATTELDRAALGKCHDNPMLRWQLQEKYSNETPEHDYVPWVMVNGKKIDEEKDDLLSVICQEYTSRGGTAAPCSTFIMSPEWN